MSDGTLRYREGFLTEMVKHACIGVALAVILLFNVKIGNELGVIDESDLELALAAAYASFIYAVIPMLSLASEFVLELAVEVYRGRST